MCLSSCLLGENRDIFFPKLSEVLHLTRFSDIAVRYLGSHGYTPVECESEDEARGRAAELIAKRQWPVYFFASDTTGEKDFEEFYTGDEEIDWMQFESIGVIKNSASYDETELEYFLTEIERIRDRGLWDKPEIVNLFNSMIPEFQHKETGKYLDARM